MKNGNERPYIRVCDDGVVASARWREDFGGAFTIDRVVSAATEKHERVVARYQRDAHVTLTWKNPYNWRERVRYEVRNNILTTQPTTEELAR
jgi:hypothetical protein